jgi:hypothetical protein
MSPLALTVEERLRACTALCEALHYFAYAASEPLIRHIPGCQPVDVVQFTPGFCMALLQHVTSVKRTLSADALNLPAFDSDGGR